MLFPEQIIPFLQHSDAHVRDLSLRYLAEAHDPSPATADDIWKAIDAFGGGEFNTFYRAMKEFPQTDASVLRTIQKLQSGPEGKIRDALERVIKNLKSGLLMRHLDEIQEAPRLGKELKDSIRERIELMKLPATELWDRLMTCGEQMKDVEMGDAAMDPQIPARLIDALSHSPEAGGWAISTLNDESIRDWREVYSVDMLGALRFRAAADLVLQKFFSDEDADCLISSCVNTLVRIGGAKVIEAIQKRFASATEGFRFFLSDVPRRIKLPQSEMAAFALHQGESELQVRTFLGWALCELATTHQPAIDTLVKMVSSDDYDDSVTDLHADVGSLCTMLGRPRPLKSSPAREPRRAFRDVPSVEYAFEEDEKEGDPIVSDPIPSLPVTIDQPRPAATIQPIRRKGAKVGRNDPCPCGSGKKYKKCCGK